MGFSAGQVQYLDLIKKDTSKLFNEEVRAPFPSLSPTPPNTHSGLQPPRSGALILRGAG